MTEWKIIFNKHLFESNLTYSSTTKHTKVAKRNPLWRCLQGFERTVSAASCFELGPCGASSASSADPNFSKRLRHCKTVGREVPNRWAMALLEVPSAATRQIRDRNATRCGVVEARTHASSVAHCSELIGRASVGFHMGIAWRTPCHCKAVIATLH